MTSPTSFSNGPAKRHSAQLRELTLPTDESNEALKTPQSGSLQSFASTRQNPSCPVGARGKSNIRKIWPIVFKESVKKNPSQGHF